MLTDIPFSVVQGIVARQDTQFLDVGSPLFALTAQTLTGEGISKGWKINNVTWLRKYGCRHV
jgi:hypothetical protein